MPVLGMAQDHGVLVRWLHRPGARVEAGTPLMEVETDKAVVEVDAPADGILADVTLEEGHEARVGTVIARIYGDGERPPAPSAVASDPAAPPTPAARVLGADGGADGSDRRRSEALGGIAGARTDHGAPPRPGPRASRSGPAPGPGADARSGRILASPKARRLARDHRMDLATLVGTGPGGAVVAADVDAAVLRSAEARAGAAASSAAFDEPRRLARVADVTELTRLLEWRGVVHAGTHLAVAAVGIALRDHRSFGAMCTMVVVTHGRSGTTWFEAPAANLGSAGAVEAARGAATALDRGRDAAARAPAEAVHGSRSVVVHDLWGFPATKEIPAAGGVEVTLGPVAAGSVVRNGAVVAGVTLPIRLTDATGALTDDEALDLLLDVVGLVEDPTGLVMRHRG